MVGMARLRRPRRVQRRNVGRNSRDRLADSVRYCADGDPDASGRRPYPLALHSLISSFSPAATETLVHYEKQRQEHRNHDAAHDHRQKNNHDRLQQ